MARFAKRQCQPCPVRTWYTTSRESTRNVGVPPRELRDLQVRVRAEQQTPDWQARHAVRSGVESTFTAIAVNIERLSGLPQTGEAPPPRPPTAFQNFLEQHGIPQLKSWRSANG